jgi:hypothetical protein
MFQTKRTVDDNISCSVTYSAESRDIPHPIDSSQYADTDQIIEAKDVHPHSRQAYQ